MLFEEHVKYSPINSTHYAKLYPQNGERIVTIDSVTSIHPMYCTLSHGSRGPGDNQGCTTGTCTGT